MDNAGSSKVEEAEVSKRVHAKDGVAAPGPATLHRIDESSHHDGKHKEAEELHALRYCARNDRHCRRHKHNLEEKVRRRCVSGCLLGASHSVAGNRAEQIIATVHNGVSAHHVHRAGHCKQRHVLGEDLYGIFTSDQTGF